MRPRTECGKCWKFSVAVTISTKKPTARIYTGAIYKPTLVVPNQVVLEILKQFAFAQFIDSRLDSIEGHTILHALENTYMFKGDHARLIEGENRKDRLEMMRRIQEELRPMQTKTFNVMSGITFHQRSHSITRARNFMRGQVLDNNH